MGVAGALVLYAVIWAVAFYCVLPLGIRTQSELRRVVRGTPGSAPERPGLPGKVVRATLFGTAVWLLAVAAIHYGWLSLDLLDVRPAAGG